MAYGNVFVFNLCADSVTLGLNGQGSAGSIASPSRMSGYTPSSLRVSRSNLVLDQLMSPLFAQGDNYLEIGAGGQLWQAKITIPMPPNVRLENDLGLYLAYRRGFLLSLNDGSIVGEFNAS